MFKKGYKLLFFIERHVMCTYMYDVKYMQLNVLNKFSISSKRKNEDQSCQKQAVVPKEIFCTMLNSWAWTVQIVFSFENLCV